MLPKESHAVLEVTATRRVPHCYFGALLVVLGIGALDMRGFMLGVLLNVLTPATL